VSYTRAGCDVGSVAAANTELENTTPDVPLVFGANSPDAKEAEGVNQDKASADYEGLSVHCALGSAVCADHHSVADLLPDEPGGYTGYRVLYGAEFGGAQSAAAVAAAGSSGGLISAANGVLGQASALTG
jgi:hypothetical protein